MAHCVFAGGGDLLIMTYVERGDLCVAVVNEATRVVVCAVGCGGRAAAVECQEWSGTTARLLVATERHQWCGRRSWPRRRRHSPAGGRRHRAQTQVRLRWTPTWLQWRRQKSRRCAVKMARHLQRQQRCGGVHRCHGDADAESWDDWEVLIWRARWRWTRRAISWDVGASLCLPVGVIVWLVCAAAVGVACPSSFSSSE